MATLHEVAKRANVSPMTVSRTINTPERVRPHMRERVEQAMKELNYRKNHAASALVNRKTGIVKVVPPDGLEYNDPYYMTIFSGITSELSKKLLAMLVIDSSVRHVSYDGAILMGLRTHDSEQLEDHYGPMAVFGNSFEGIDCVDVDNFNGIRQLTEYLISLGHQRLSYLSLDYDEPFVLERERGFKAAVAEAGLAEDDCPIIKPVHNSIQGGFAAGERLLPTSASTAFVCGTDLIAIGLMQAAQSMGLKVPQDLSITGFDGVGADTMCNPMLTTAKQPVFEIGCELAKLLIKRIEQGDTNIRNPVQILVPVQIIKRGSTAAPKTD